ncbi:MAG: peptidylprolyl isomerase [Acidobacteriota bacterium]
MKFSQLLFALLCAFLFASTVLAQEPQLVDETVARVNTDLITRSMLLKAQKDFEEELKAKYPNDPAKAKEEFDRGFPIILDLLIEDRLISQRAAELSIDVEADINRTILDFAKQSGIPSLREFEETLKRQGVDIEDYRRNIRANFQRRAVLFRDVISPIYEKLTELEKRQWYDSNKKFFATSGEVKISEIFISLEGRSAAEAEALAKQAVAQARAGKSFTELVTTYSDPQRPSVQKGGELPKFKDDEIIDYLRKVVDNLKEGEVSDPIQTDKGFQIVRLDERKAAGFRDFTEVEIEVSEAIAFEKGNTQLKDYFKKLRDKAYIRIAEQYKPSGSEATTPN